MPATGVEGIDVSSYQRGLDWKQAAKDVSFAWLKVSEGATWSDPTYGAAVAAARAAGVKVGGYHWAHPESHPDPKVEADKFLSHLQFEPGDLRPALDFEEPKATGLGAATLEKWALRWIDLVESELGCAPLLYVNPNWLHSVLGGARRIKSAKVDIWLADYGPNDGSRHRTSSFAAGFPVVAHQYTSRGRVRGWGEVLDRDFGPDLTKLLARAPAVAAASRPTPPWVAELNGKAVVGHFTDRGFIEAIRGQLKKGKEVTLRPRGPGE